MLFYTLGLCGRGRTHSTQRTLLCADANVAWSQWCTCVCRGVAKAAQCKISGYSTQMLGHRYAAATAGIANRATESTAGGQLVLRFVVPVQDIEARVVELDRGCN